MREITHLTSWMFTKTDAIDAPAADWSAVTLPHTWNALDGQDGGDDYDRRRCWYQATVPAIAAGKCAFCEFQGANHIAEVYINGVHAARHEGGFSTFRVDVTAAALAGDVSIAVSVDNGQSHVYPQMADFTFYGGLYRMASYIVTEAAHFDLMRRGTNGVFVTPTPAGKGAQVRIDAFTQGAQGCTVQAELLDAAGAVVATVTAPAQEQTTLMLALTQATRWHGLENPYLYTARLTLQREGAVLDSVDASFGVREFSVDPDKGFFLNGVSYPLHGVSRHQDRQDMGWALTEKEHRQDIDLIEEVGANTIRLAHYQHAQEFYRLCNETGFVLWAEIPFISRFMPEPLAVENTLFQMEELIAQNYNHPAICFWGIANEITIGGDKDPALLDNLERLNTLTRNLDPSRLTTMAQLTMLKPESTLNQLTDVLSYNHYYGWYMGEVAENGPWLDDFHKRYPTRAIGVSEYGAEAVLQWHTATPKVRDYTEEYQTYYHEEMLKTFAARPYLWSTHVWNMFDFAADARDEGGCVGRNNKGLISYDRTLKKDAFYIYKAYWTTAPFVHICAKRFAKRAEGQMTLKVYSNCPAVTLTVNGKAFALTGDKVFVLENAPLHMGENTVVATAEGALSDSAVFEGVSAPVEAYVLPQEAENSALDGLEGVENWFDKRSATQEELTFPEGYFSIRDTIGALTTHPETAQILMHALTSMLGKEMMGGGMAKTMFKFMKDKPLEGLFKMAGDRLPPQAKAILNEQLTKVRKE